MDIIQQALEQTLRAAQAHHAAGRFPQAEALYRQVLSASPRHPRALALLGVLALHIGKPASARDLLRQSVALAPNDWEAQTHLAAACMQLDCFDEALSAIARAESLNITDPRIPSNHASLLGFVGRNADCYAALQRALERAAPGAPNAATLHSNLLSHLHFINASPADVLAAHRRWNDLHAFRSPVTAFPNDRSPDRPLRIGYLSPDFRTHAVSFFFEPLLAHHDQSRFHTFLYSNHAVSDTVTARLKSHAHTFRDITRLPDPAAANLIRQDAIDLLIDLAGHTSDNRLPLITHGIAPVVCSYLGYPDTTGAAAIHYRLTDPYLDPPGIGEAHYSETLLRLPTYAIYQPPADLPDVSPPPCESNGYITFGCFANVGKWSDPTLAAWVRLLQAVPDSRLRLIIPGLEHNEMLPRLRHLLASHNIAPERLLPHPRAALQEYFALHQQVDINLDPFPLSGHTVLVHALWMGVPHVSLAGNAAWQRLGASQLHALELPDLIATSPDDYVHKLAALALDLPRLKQLRSTLRDRMRRSPLMAYAPFTRALESLYRTAWQLWCAR